MAHAAGDASGEKRHSADAERRLDARARELVAPDHPQREVPRPRSVQQRVLAADHSCGDDVPGSREDVQIDEQSDDRDAGDQQDNVRCDLRDLWAPEGAWGGKDPFEVRTGAVDDSVDGFQYPLEVRVNTTLALNVMSARMVATKRNAEFWTNPVRNRQAAAGLPNAATALSTNHAGGVADSSTPKTVSVSGVAYSARLAM